MGVGPGGREVRKGKGAGRERGRSDVHVHGFGAFERGAKGLLGDESVLHVDPDALLVHPSRVGLGVVLSSSALAHPRR